MTHFAEEWRVRMPDDQNIGIKSLDFRLPPIGITG